MPVKEEQMKAAESQTTTDHKIIQKWVEKRHGRPATVKSTGTKGEKAGLLRIHFPEYSGTEKLEEISWEEFFKKFEESKLAFLYQEKRPMAKSAFSISLSTADE